VSEQPPRDPDVALRARALEELLLEKGLLETGTIDRIARRYEHDVGPLNGARVVARAWSDAAFRARLLDDGTEAIRELGLLGYGTDRLVAVENTADVHNLVVCTLCSCYPWSVLGLPPGWYKSPEYRARAVREPRAVLNEFGVELADDVEVRVWDSSAEVRYLVLPERPAGSDALGEDELAALVTRDAMIGVAR
jgi:nitrile hydratase